MSNLSRTDRRKNRVRRKLKAVSNGALRLSVHRTARHISVQLIDDQQGVTLCAASTMEKDVLSKVKNGGNILAAQEVGRLIAERAKKHSIEKLVFDRGGFLFHGRIKALADSARENGLKF